MAKTSGLGSSLIVGSVDLSGDIGDVSSIETSRSTQDVPAINQSAMDRIMLLKDGSLAFNSYWDTAAAAAHLTLSALPRTDVQVSYLHSSVVGDAAATMIAKQVTYAPTRGADGSLIVGTNAQANAYGLEWGELLTTGAQSFATGTVNGTSIDLGSVSTLFGAAAYLHVISVASGTATFTVEDSANDSAFTAVAGMAFAGATGATTERVQGAINATVRRYVRITGSGVHGAAVVVVNFVRYLASPV